MLFAALAWPCAAPCRAQQEADEDSLQLRIAWGGGAERVWTGSIRLSEGTFSQLRALGVEADEPGTIWLDHDTIEVRQRSPRAYDGIDAMITAPLDARLLVSLSAADGDDEPPTEIPLRLLASQTHNNNLDGNGNRLIVSRSPGDKLRVQFDREHLVFAPGEAFQFEIAAHLLDGTKDLHYRAQITGSPGGAQVWQQDYDSGEEGTATTVGIKVPNEEGVYDLTLSVTQSSKIRWRQMRKTLAERKIQFVVVSPRAPTEPPPGQLTRIVDINPVNPRWWERLGNLQPIPALRKGPWGNGDAAEWNHPKLGPLVQLGPGGIDSGVSWEAYPLPINTPGQPHVLEIEYPSDVPQVMGISLIEPNAAGVVTPIGLDSGVYVSDEEAENPPRLLKHRVIFWPRTKTPWLLLTNQRQNARAVYGKIAVLGGNHVQFPVLGLGRADGGNLLPPAFAGNTRPERLWASYLDRPLLVANFSAPEALDPVSHRSLEDWFTFYQGGLRLAKYLKHVGYGGVMMSVFADGSTIYPSQLVAPTPRYDTGVFFSSGQDPQRKDTLELLFRLFDRENLVLIPGLDFASPLPELETLKRRDGHRAVGLEWVNAEGLPWLATNTPRQGLAPYYNLLDERVQRAMLNVASELVERYASHPSFGGLALQLSADGYAQLPGDEWGFDDQTIARFQRDMSLRVPGQGAERFAARAEYLMGPTGPGHQRWVQWRTRVVSDFHKRLRQEITRAHPGAKLYLAGGTMLDGRTTQERLRPALLRRARLDDALAALGIRAAAYQEEDDIVLLRPQQVRPLAGSLPPQPADWEINLTPGEMDKLFAGTATTGGLFYHEPQKTRLASFDAKSPFGPANTFTWLCAEMSPSADRNRRRFVHSLATLDAQEVFDGGWLLPLGQEDALHEIISVYRQLPRERFDTLPGEFQPITIRTLATDRSSYVYLVNDSPWDTSVTLQLDLPAECKLEKLGESRGIGPLVRSGGQTSCRITLRPYDLVAARFSARSARVRGAVSTVSQQVQQGLQRRIQDLSARVAVLGNPQPSGALENPSFEVPSESDQIVGWTVSAPMDTGVTVDETLHHSGGHSLRLASGGQPVAIVSGPVRPPATGRLVVEMWLRGAGVGRQPAVRMGVEAPWRDGRYVKYGIIGGANTLGANWEHYTFPIDDMPSNGLADLVIKVELLSAGEVWVDDIELFDLAFSEPELRELTKQIGLASVKLERGQLADCARLLEGYWPQFLVANVPLAQTSAGPRPRAARAPATPPKRTALIDSIKSYLPRTKRE